MTPPKKVRQHNSTLSRSTSLRSSGGPRTRTPMKKRAPSNAEQERKYGPPERREWMKSQPCIVCGRRPSDSAHITNGGMSRKAHYTLTVPLCADDPATGYSGHHTEYDGGKRSFVAKYHVDLPFIAAVIEKTWQKRLAASSDLEHIGSIVPRVVAAAQHRKESA